MSSFQYYQPQESLKVAEGIYRTQIDGLYYLRYKKFIDERGLFSQIIEPARIKEQVNPDFQIKQINLSVSKEKVARGIHAEGWNKLVTVVQGRAHCILTDVRPDSPTFKKVEYFDLRFNPQNDYGEGLYISKKIGNSLCAIEGPVYYLYGVDLLYGERNPADDQAISIFDPELNLAWPFPKEEMIISERDINSINLADLKTES